MNPERWAQITDLFNRASELPIEERRTWLEAACPDEELRREVAAMLETYDTDPDFLEQAADVRTVIEETTGGALIGRVLGQYRLVRVIGRGGMGVVYEAQRDDREFDRRAAIKILPAWSAAALGQRFRFERHVLAGLDHEGIARLIDAGTTDDGVQFFVMEYVDGQPIDRFCRERALTLSDRIALIERVLDAVSYAHQQLVVHRDIKPANILVTADGDPKLLDFGIAAMLSAEGGSSVGTTRTGHHHFTPEFASPEQMRGERVSTASDVYSLGALAYLLLAGRPPYAVGALAPLEALRAVCELDPPLMSAVADPALRKALAGDLDRVIAKALAKAPRDRYAGAAAFAADFQAWREGRPVSATAPTFTYRARRFVTRNRTVVTAATALSIALIAGGTATAWQARIARQERDKAQNRFRQVREFSRSLLFDVHDALRPLAGATEPRRLLLDRATQFLDGLAADAGDDDALMVELAEGYRRLGSVQGSAGTDNLGDTAAAIRSFLKGADLAERALAIQPGARDRLVVAIDVTEQLASAQGDLGELNAAEPMRARHLALVRELERLYPADPVALEQVAGGYSNQGIMHADRNDLPGARNNYLAAVRILESLPADRRVAQRRSYILTLKRLGAVELVQGALDDSERHYRAALTTEEDLLRQQPDNKQLRFELSYSLSDLGLVLSRRGNHADALEMWLRALGIRRAALAADPKNARMLAAVATMESRLGGAAARLAKHEEAVGYFRASLAHTQALPLQPGVWTDRSSRLASATAYLAEALLDLAAAQPATRRALVNEARALAGGVELPAPAPGGAAPSSELRELYEKLRARLAR